MRLFLIRHAETVDNIAHLYAGSRDSPLTNHGVQQAARLGAHFRRRDVAFTHIFTSPLQRARKTAELIAEGQAGGVGAGRTGGAVVVREVRARENGDCEGAAEGARSRAEAVAPCALPHLAEQDFGSLEGVSYLSRPWSHAQNRELNRPVQVPAAAPYVEPESVAAVHERLDRFLDGWLVPLVRGSVGTRSGRGVVREGEVDAEDGEEGEVVKEGPAHTVAVVSHGIALTHLWRRLLARLHRPHIRVGHGVELADGGSIERLGGWANTGAVEVLFERVDGEADADDAGGGDSVGGSGGVRGDGSADGKGGRGKAGDEGSLRAFRMTLVAVNDRRHLEGLKRTRGGVGSAAFDGRQRSLDGFFGAGKRRNGVLERE